MYKSSRRIGGCVLVLSIMVCGSGACKRWIAAPAPQNVVTDVRVFSSDSGATSAMLGVYISIMDNYRSFFNGAMSLYGALSSDELYRTTVLGNEDAFTLNALTSMNPLCNNLYTTAYTWIYDCNNILSNLATAAAVSDSVKQQLEGEAKFLRAFTYFYLVNCYGGVPLTTSTDYQQNMQLARATDGEVYEQVVADLLDAERLLGTAYLRTDRIRPSRACATALLARVYLYQGKWVQAAAAADSVINDGHYLLETNLDNVFQASSQETIWQLQPVHGGIYTAEGFLFIPAASNVRPTYTLSNWLLGSFGAGDQRLVHWTKSMKDSNTYTYPFKYQSTSIKAARVEYDVVLRLAEQYLIRAEARVHLGDMTGAVADVNVIRQRAGLPGLGVAGLSSFIPMLFRERQTEFFAEWGHRWFDLKRSGWADSVLGVEKKGWNAYDTLYPIPLSELSRNAAIVQNPGY